MLPATEQVFLSAVALPAEERFQLIGALIAAEQTVPPFDDTWREIIQRRSAEIDTATVIAVPWSQVRERLCQRVGRDAGEPG